MIVIYTDGSARASNHTWIGAYAYSIYRNGKSIYQESKAIKPATVNFCELLAAANAIHTCVRLFPDEDIQLYTDSQYVITGSANPASNKKNKQGWSLWQSLVLNRNIQLFHVKGHDKDVRNKHVDTLAKSMLRSQFDDGTNA